jgi:flagellar biogenesis protein FliO
MDVAAESGRQILSLILVFALLGGTVWKFGRFLPFRGSALKRTKEKSLRGLERLALTPQHTLHLVDFAGQELLIATHPGGVSLVTPHARARSVEA